MYFPEGTSTRVSSISFSFSIGGPGSEVEISSYFHQWHSSSTLVYEPTTPHHSSFSSGEGLTLETSAFLKLSRW